MARTRIAKVKSDVEMNLPVQARIETLLASFHKMSNRDIFDTIIKDSEFISAIEDDSVRSRRSKECALDTVPAFDPIVKQRLEEQIRSVRSQWDKRMNDIHELSQNLTNNQTFSIDEIPDENISRIQIGDSSIDNIFGDGLTPGVYGPVLGKTYLFGGSEGVGKSRLMISIAGLISNPDREDIQNAMIENNSDVSCIYFQNEVPLTTFKQWAKGKISNGSSVVVSEENRLSEQLALIEKNKPLVVIIDSLHMIVECDNFRGVLRSLNTLRYHAMTHGYALFLICHLNKSGDIAGSKKVSYLVDCILKAEGHLIPNQFTFSCPSKNRYGRSGVSVLCQHTTDGVQIVSSEKNRNNNMLFSGQRPAILLNKEVLPKPALVEKSDNDED